MASVVDAEKLKVLGEFLCYMVHFLGGYYFVKRVSAVSLMHPNLRLLMCNLVVEFTLIGIGRIGDYVVELVMPFGLQRTAVCVLFKVVQDTGVQIAGLTFVWIALERLMATLLIHTYEQKTSTVGKAIVASAMSISRSQALALLLLRRRKRKQRRRFGIHPINRMRDERGELCLLPQLRAHPERFVGYFRMSPELFDSLLHFVESSLVKLSARKPISPEHRLALTLRFLATGASFRHLAYSFRMGKSTIQKIVVETCKAIWAALHDVYVRVPQTTAEWLTIAGEFERRWNVPHCLGAIDGKHINIVCPPNSGSLFYNYKGHFSVSLLAVCDARYRILYMDSGNYGKASDGGLFDSSDLKRAMDNGQLNLPDPEPVVNGGRVLPYFFVGDAAFPLSDRMMKPFPMTNGMDESRRLFNYRLCRAYAWTGLEVGLDVDLESDLESCPCIVPTSSPSPSPGTRGCPRGRHRVRPRVLSTHCGHLESESESEESSRLDSDSDSDSRWPQ